MKVLLLGATGYVGSNMMLAFDRKEIDVTGWSSKDCDLCYGTIPDLSQFDFVVNCAGLADMNRAVDDLVYLEKMWAINVTAPARVLSNYWGRFVHISSPFAGWPSLCSYNESKWIADNFVAEYKDNTTIVFPGWLYGGVNSRQIDFILNSNIDKHLIIDNVRLSNPTHIDWFCDAVVWLTLNNSSMYHIIVAEKPAMTAECFAKSILGIWGSQWIAGVYYEAAKRPPDSSYENRYKGIDRCVKENGEFHVRPYLH